MKNYLSYYRGVPFSSFQAILAALGIAALIIIQQYIYHLSSGFDFAFSWDIVSIRALVNYLLWVPIIPVAAHLSQAVLAPGRIPKTAWIQLGVGFLGLSVLHRFLAVGIVDGIYCLWNDSSFNFFRPSNLPVLWTGVFASLFQVSLIAGLIGGISYYQRFLKQQKALAQAELNALKMQLHPHFLFNTFHSIAALIDIDQEAAQLMLSRLSFLLRALLEKEKEQKISLREELEFTRHYLGIEQVRFQDRLSVNFHIQPETLSASVPTMILQPLVENALKHGISQVSQGGILTISSDKMEHDILKIRIEDNGPGISTEKSGFGLGLQNVQQRLEQLYGKDFSLKTYSIPGGGYRVTILIPLEIISTTYHAYSHHSRR